MFCDLISSGNAKIYLPFSNEGWDVRSWQKDESQRQILY